VVAVVGRPVEADDTPPVERGLRAAPPLALANSARRVDGPAAFVTTITRPAMLLVLWCCGGGIKKDRENLVKR